MGVQEVEPQKLWPSGDSRPIAVLPFDLAQLAARYGIAFREGTDDLDQFRFVAIELANGEQAWISKHDGDPNPGVVVYVDAESDIGDAQRMLLEALSLKREELLWAAPQPAISQAAANFS